MCGHRFRCSQHGSSRCWNRNAGARDLLFCGPYSSLYHAQNEELIAGTKITIGKEIWLDPTEAEAKAGSSSLILACMPALGVVTNVWQNGRMLPQQGLEVSRLSHTWDFTNKFRAVHQRMPGEMLKHSLYSGPGSSR